MRNAVICFYRVFIEIGIFKLGAATSPTLPLLHDCAHLKNVDFRPGRVCGVPGAKSSGTSVSAYNVFIEIAFAPQNSHTFRNNVTYVRPCVITSYTTLQRYVDMLDRSNYWAPRLYQQRLGLPQFRYFPYIWGVGALVAALFIMCFIVGA